ncbi:MULTISPECIES: hypothetical protein [unclassified Calothrix]|uniref:hypothetical protein n=1 Tax=unclassified Calothrix TaxID=2619626 RepID=UPI0028C49A90|nr:hypothetical protein [Calothrix sp. FACHB-168]
MYQNLTFSRAYLHHYDICPVGIVEYDDQESQIQQSVDGQTTIQVSSANAYLTRLIQLYSAS